MFERRIRSRPVTDNFDVFWPDKVSRGEGYEVSEPDLAQLQYIEQVVVVLDDAFCIHQQTIPSRRCVDPDPRPS